MDGIPHLRAVRSHPELCVFLTSQRQMSASTPPALNTEVRLLLSDECYIPLPQSPTISEYEQEDEKEEATREHELVGGVTEAEAQTLPKQIPIPLLGLLHAIQADKYETRRLAVLQDEAYGLFHKCGSYDRFITIQTQLYKHLVDCFRTDKKTTFVSLYGKAMSHPAFGELRARYLQPDDETDELQATSWVDRLPPASRQSMIDFLHSLRSDPDFVAERISRLSQAQLKKLVRLHKPMENGPIFRAQQSQGRNGSRAIPKLLEYDMAVDDLLSDPLLLMIHAMFDTTPVEKASQIDVWSSVCARLIEEGKPGADDFCLTVVSLFMDASTWNGTSRLELLLSELVVAGGQFLEAGGHNIKFTHPQYQPGDANAATSSFLDSYVPRLLDQLSIDAAPSHGLDLLRAILTKIRDPEKRITARNFFFLRWYCSIFLAGAIVYPENHGIMMDHHINNSVRQKVLRELAMRVQSTVSDVLSPWSSHPVSTVLESKIRQILHVFETPPQQKPFSQAAIADSRSFLFLRPEDILSMARSLVGEIEDASSATSVLERASSSSSLGLAYQSQFIPAFPNVPLQYSGHNNVNSQSQTWHGSRPMVDSGYSTFDRTMARPTSSGGILPETEKTLSLPFLHDLWGLTSSQDFQMPGPSKHEVAVIFIRDSDSTLSLDPFNHNLDYFRTESNELTISDDDKEVLTTAVIRLAYESSQFQADSAEAEPIFLETLTDMIYNKIDEANSSFDFQTAYFWWKCSQILQSTSSSNLVAFLEFLADQRQARVVYKRGLAREYDEWLHTLRTRSTTQDQKEQKLSTNSKQLRNKMWFVSDVRHSSAYEDAHNVVRALRTMIDPSDQRQQGTNNTATKQKFRSSFSQERVLAQVLELMTAPKTYGGPNKLSESQVEITSGWLLHENIENFCRGEERIHRFCYEIQRCVKRLAGEAMLDSPVLWSSPLYLSEKLEHGIAGHSGPRASQDRSPWRADFSSPQWSLLSKAPGQQPFPGPESMLPSMASPSPKRNSFEYGATQPHMPPTNPPFGAQQTSRNWKPPPSSASVVGGIQSSFGEGTAWRRRAFLQSLRAHLTGLLLSDLGSSLWSNGSETDRWMSAPNKSRQPSPGVAHGAALSPGSWQRSLSSDETKQQQFHSEGGFNFTDPYRILLQQFQLNPDPQVKLQHLYDLFILVGHAQQSANMSQRGSIAERDDAARQAGPSFNPLGIGVGVPRTRLTRLQEVAANCEDRRVSSLANSRFGGIFSQRARTLPMPNLDDAKITAAIQMILEDPEYRPATFFRDLQYIAAFTPSATLDHTPQGTAFWTIGLAAMKIKAERSRTMIDNAMQILDFHYGNGNKKEPVRAGQSSPSQSSSSTRKLSQQDLIGTTLQDAARLLTVSALEGDPAAARELALFHLTHPELVSRVTLPLSRPSDVFRAKHGTASERGHWHANDESGVLDTLTFAVVFHWMEFAANAGDADAITFFKENKDLGKAL